MTISSSLNAGVAALSANATRLAAISDNIANSATYGYKRVETDFQSMVISGSGGGYSAGGVRSTTQRLIDQGGSLTTTSNPTDLAVRGRGMLPVMPGSQVASGAGGNQMLLTTTGSFRTDANGYLKTEGGLVLMGWPAAADGTIPSYPRDTAEELKPVKINMNRLTGEPTTAINLGVNLPASATTAGAPGTPEELSVVYYDNMGKEQKILVTFSPVVPATPGDPDSNTWRMTLADSRAPATAIGEYDLVFDDSRASGGTLSSATLAGAGSVFADGSFTVTIGTDPIEVTIGKPFSPDGMTQLGNRFAPLDISRDGSPVGNMISAEVDENGYVYAAFDTGVTRLIYQVPLVDVPNPNGLMSLDQQTYRPTTASGSFFLWDAGDGPTGDIISFARQESATDVAGELTDMIQTQRAYSSNAKVIQTVDEMLQETTNIKR